MLRIQEKRDRKLFCPFCKDYGTRYAGNLDLHALAGLRICDIHNVTTHLHYTVTAF